MKSFQSTRSGLGLNRIASLLCLTFLLTSAHSQGEKRKGEGRKGNRPDKKDTSTWTAEEYSGLRNEKDLQAALASKGFTWITGSPADNEKLSVGKNAQFFGFVALRYQSGRAANRGTLGRAFFAVADEAQKRRMAQAVRAEKEALQNWWSVREEILTRLEDHLYTGLPIDREELHELGERFSLLNCEVAVHEARAYAEPHGIPSRTPPRLACRPGNSPEAWRWSSCLSRGNRS